jgi:HK97 gp10 family phage protein
MAIRISISGGNTADALVKALDAVPAKTERAVRAVVRATAMRVEGTAKERIQRPPKTGRLYRTYNKRKLHRASAPGESPATDSGTLASRVFHEVQAGGFEASVASDVRYAGYLEFGTRRMAPRPYLAPALREHADSFLRDLDLAVAGALDL